MGGGRKGILGQGEDWWRVVPGADREQEVGLGPEDMPDPNPVPKKHTAAFGCLHLLGSVPPPEVAQNHGSMAGSMVAWQEPQWSACSALALLRIVLLLSYAIA